MRIWLCGFLLLLAANGWAEKADKDKPVNLEADRVTVDDANKTQVLEGNVQLTRGTLVILADRIVVTQDADGFQKGVASAAPGSAGLARFRQKREGRDEYINGEAERIEYSGRDDKTQLFIRAHVKSGQDEVSGQYIAYDGLTEKYLATGGANGSNGASASGQRVRAVIQPKKDSKPAAAAPPPALTPAKQLSSKE